jgi:hypothetical protein
MEIPEELLDRNPKLARLFQDLLTNHLSDDLTDKKIQAEYEKVLNH